MNDEPLRVKEPKAMTWPLQSDTRDAPKPFLEAAAVPIFLALLIALLAYPGAASVCSIPCDPKCPTSNGSLVCEPVNFEPAVSIAKSVLGLNESTTVLVGARNLENNLSLSCVYSAGALDFLTPVAISEGTNASLGYSTVTSPATTPGYQQIIGTPVQVACTARIVNVSNPSGKYLWCGSSCIEQSVLYTYPTSAEAEEYQRNKFLAANEIAKALSAISEARKMLEKARAAVEQAKAAGGVDVAYPEARIADAEAALEEALVYYGEASYAFDQSHFSSVAPKIALSLPLLSQALSYGAEAYGSVVYTGKTGNYVSWYVNSTGLLIGEIGQILEELAPILEQSPQGPLSEAALGWSANLSLAKDLVDQAKEKIAQGDETGALSLLERARGILIGIRDSIDKAFDLLYAELLKAASNDNELTRQSVDNLESLVNSSAKSGRIQKADYSKISEGISKARSHLKKALAQIAIAEAAREGKSLRKAVNAALIEDTNARYEAIIATTRYRIATFRVESLIALLTVLSALFAGVIILKDLYETSKRERAAHLEKIREKVRERGAARDRKTKAGD